MTDKPDNVASLREALKHNQRMAFEAKTTTDSFVRHQLLENRWTVVDAFLFKSPRNCDIGNADELYEKYAVKRGLDSACLVCKCIDCCEDERYEVIKWMLSECNNENVV